VGTEPVRYRTKISNGLILTFRVFKEMEKSINLPGGISACFPAFNDGGTIVGVVRAALEILPQLTDSYEVIVVNDGSSDHTSDVLAEIGARHPEVRVIEHTRNLGYGAALRSGFQAVTKEWVFYTDGDGQYDPREMLTLAGVLTPEIDVVNGYKIARNDPGYRILIGAIFRRLTRVLYGIRLRDVNCDFRLMRRSLFDRVKLESDSGAICVEMIRKFQDAGARFAEVPVHHYPRMYGRSQIFSVSRMMRIIWQLGIVWWQLIVKRDRRPQTVPTVTPS